MANTFEIIVSLKDQVSDRLEKIGRSGQSSFKNLESSSQGAARGVNDVDGKVKQVDSSLDKASKSGSGFGNILKSVGTIAAGFVLAQGLMQAPQVIGSFISAASNANEVQSKSNTVFKEAASTINQWASGSARDFGLSTSAALEAASGFGNMFAQLGIGLPVAADMSTGITELAADFASFHNADISEVISAQSAAFRGEYDALQRFLPLINAATVEQEAMAMTGKANAKELTAQEKALAVYELMLKGAGDAMGDFDRTSNSLANQQRQLGATWDNIKVKIGSVLVPILATLAGVILNQVIPAFGKIGDVVGPMLEKVGMVASAFKSAFSGEGITSDGIVGKAEGIGVALRGIFDGVMAALPGIIEALSGIGQRLVEAFGAFVENAGPGLVELFGALKDLAIELAPVLLAIAESIILPGLETVVPLLGEFVGIAAGVLAWAIETEPVLAALAAAILVTMVPSVIAWATAQWALTAAWIAGAVAFVILNAPLILMAVLIAALVAAIVLLIQNWDQVAPAISAALDAALSAVTSAWEAIKSAVSAAVNFVIEFVRNNWQLLVAILAGPLGLAVLAVIKHWDEIKSAINSAIEAVKGFVTSGFEAVKGAIEGAMQAIGSVVSSTWETIKSTVSGAVNSVIGFVADLASRIVSTIQTAMSEFGSSVSSGIDTVVTFFSELPGRILGAIGDMSSLLYDVGRQVVQGLLNGLESLAGTVIDKAKSIGNSVKDGIAGALSLGSPSRVTKEQGRFIAEGLEIGMQEGTPRTVEAAEMMGSSVVERVVSARQRAQEILNDIERIAQQAWEAAESIQTRNEQTPAQQAAFGSFDRLKQLNDMPDDERARNSAEIHRLANELGYSVFEDNSVMMPGTVAYDSNHGSMQSYQNGSQQPQINVTYQGPVTINARDMDDAKRSQDDTAYGLMAAVQERGM